MNELCIACIYNNIENDHKPCFMCINNEKNKGKKSITLEKEFGNPIVKLNNYYTSGGY